MPIYEYKCLTCENVFEVIRKFSEMDDELPCSEVECPIKGATNEPKEKQNSLSSFALKGSGWYKTDYK